MIAFHIFVQINSSLKPTKIYFASDQHLGAPSKALSDIREKKFLRFLDKVERDATALFLLGDLFDFWFDYKKVVPKGFVRVLGKLAQMRDNGLPIYFFVGNHDLWMNGYFEEELDIPVFHEPQIFEFDTIKFFIGHGDGKGPGDMGYKRMKKVFTNPFSKWLFGWIHPDIGVSLAQYLSVKNKLISGADDVTFLGAENEWLFQYAKRKHSENPCDFYIFGHRHLPLEIPIDENATYINLGDWVSYFTYGVFENKTFELKKFE